MFASVRLGWTRFNVKVDLSYGIYIYGTLMLQVLVAVGLGSGSLSLMAYLSLAFVLTLGVAAISWFAIEKPALDLKRHRWTFSLRRV